MILPLRPGRWLGWIVLLALVVLLLSPLTIKAESQHRNYDSDEKVTLTLIGRVVNTQKAPIEEADVRVIADDHQFDSTYKKELESPSHTEESGFFIISYEIPTSLIHSENIAVEIHKQGYRTAQQEITYQDLTCSNSNCFLRIPDIVLSRIFNAAFIYCHGYFYRRVRSNCPSDFTRYNCSLSGRNCDVGCFIHSGYFQS